MGQAKQTHQFLWTFIVDGCASRLGQMNPIILKVGSKPYKLPILF